MPEFENLEPFLDGPGGQIMPVAPHSTTAHDFVLQRRDGRPPAPRKRTIAPEPVEVGDIERLTTREMEKAYREAMKASRARKKAQRTGGKSIFGRICDTVLRIFGKKTTSSRANAGEPRAAKTPTQARNRRPSGRGQKPEGKRQPRVEGSESTDTRKNSNGSRPRQRSRNRTRGGKNGNSAQGGAPRGDLPQKQGARRRTKDSPENQENASQNGGRSRRRRPKRDRQAPANTSSKAPKSSE